MLFAYLNIENLVIDIWTVFFISVKIVPLTCLNEFTLPADLSIVGRESSIALVLINLAFLVLYLKFEKAKLISEMFFLLFDSAQLDNKFRQYMQVPSD